jgi:hypothetical protein
MASNIDTLIEKTEKELSPFYPRMEEIKIEFIKQTIIFASEWYAKTAKDYVIKYPEVTLNMSKEKLTKMKVQVSELIKNTEKIVKGELDNPALWWHQRPTINTSVDQYLPVADKQPEILDRAIRHVLGRLGLILEDFWFRVTASGNTGSYREFWFEKSSDNAFSSSPIYPHLLMWSREMQETIRKYNTEYTQALALYMKITKFKDEKRRLQAIDRWESI